MTAVTESTIGRYRPVFEQRRAASPAWLGAIRKTAMARFSALGFPTTQDEEWRFTNIEPIARTPFEMLAGDATPSVTLEQLTGYLFEPDTTPRLVFVNGRLCSDLSTLDRLPAGVSAGSLSELLAGGDELLERHLARYINTEDNALAALNTALFADGACVHIARGAAVQTPIHLVFVTVPADKPAAVFPRTLIVADESSESRIVESFVGRGEGTTWTCAATEIVAGANAFVDHYRDQREATTAYHTSMLRLQLARDSHISSHALAIGGRLVRNDVHAALDGEGADATMNGLFVPIGEQHIDNHLRVDHIKPHCTSWEFYKGILDDHAHGVFSGRIYVAEGAQKTDAKQSNDNLLLSRDAQIDTKPQLEIFADDVRCTHGATIGQVDDEAMFYLRTRGFAEAAARSLLVYAFAGESLGQIQIAGLRDQIQAIILGRLPHGAMLQAESPLFYGNDFSEHIRAIDRRRESY